MLISKLKHWSPQTKHLLRTPTYSTVSTYVYFVSKYLRCFILALTTTGILKYFRRVCSRSKSAYKKFSCKKRKSAGVHFKKLYFQKKNRKCTNNLQMTSTRTLWVYMSFKVYNLPPSGQILFQWFCYKPFPIYFQHFFFIFPLAASLKLKIRKYNFCVDCNREDNETIG